MIKPDMRRAIYELYLQGMSKRKIAGQLGISRNTVKAIIKAKGTTSRKTRADLIQVDELLLQEIYADCEGWAQRVHEVLTEQKQLKIGYSTLTRQLRVTGLSIPHKVRCDSVPDQPGAEIQHDTTIYQIKIGEKKLKIIASLLYYRYSKIRYLKFYRRFNRFRMKCFLHEALVFFGYCAPTCIIDNTNLARLSGSGKNAVITAEMEHFSSNYGFTFQCHALNHPNRKAGNERGFYTVESNFLPGRSFKSMEDLNQQALEWATVRMFHKKVGKMEIIPSKAFEHERSFLKVLPPFVPPPYQNHLRKTDQYGFATFKTNHYWVPGTGRHDVLLLEFDRHLEIHHHHQLLAKYDLPPEGTKRQVFSNDNDTKPKYRPKNSRRPTEPEEKKLRALSPGVADWLDRRIQDKVVRKHRLIRSLYSLYLKLGRSLFLRTMERACEYGIKDFETLESIAGHLLKNEDYVLPEPALNQEFKTRKSYIDGFASDEADLSQYDNLLGG